VVRRRRVFDAIADALLDPQAPTVVVMEDVHWADDISLQVLGHLTRRIAGSRHRLVLTYRQREQSAELRSTLAEPTRRRVVARSSSSHSALMRSARWPRR
jgi:predicted ATPase